MVTCCVEKFKMSKMVDFIADLYTTLEKLVIANFHDQYGFHMRF